MVAEIRLVVALTSIEIAGSWAGTGEPEMMGLAGRRRPGMVIGMLEGMIMGGQAIFSISIVVVACLRKRLMPTMTTAARVMKPRGPLANSPVLAIEPAVLPAPDWTLS